MPTGQSWPSSASALADHSNVLTSRGLPASAFAMALAAPSSASWRLLSGLSTDRFTMAYMPANCTRGEVEYLLSMPMTARHRPVVLAAHRALGSSTTISATALAPHSITSTSFDVAIARSRCLSNQDSSTCHTGGRLERINEPHTAPDWSRQDVFDG